MMKKKIINRNLKSVSNMPPLHHTLPGEKYNHKKSEVFRWISTSPELLIYVFDHAKEAGLISYNPSTGKWQGVDYDE